MAAGALLPSEWLKLADPAPGLDELRSTDLDPRDGPRDECGVFGLDVLTTMSPASPTSR